MFVCVHLWLIALCLGAFPETTNAQVRPVYDYGAIGLGQLLKRLNNTKSVMHIGAHPDDEDSGLLAYLARGENARTAYLSLTRGDGGQNIIGPELFESLGVIRTEELLQARRLDGAEQYFTRAYDYGFSKTLDEAKQKWDEKIILCDAVRAIRTFRPLVVISRFSGTTADGHGQHQFAGYIAPLAVRAAADANQCNDAGAAWQVLKFYVGQGFRSTAEPTLRINTGEYDYLLGRSYFEIAMEGRSQHKTQEQGVLELKGERFSGLNLIETKVPKVEKERSVFDGIDVTLAGAPKLFGGNEKLVGEGTKAVFVKMQQSLEKILKEFNPNNYRQILPTLIEEKNSAGNLFLSYIAFSGTPERRRQFDERNAREAGIGFIAAVKTAELSKAIELASGIQIEALVNQETVVPGETFQASIKVFHPADPNIKIKEIKLRAPQNWQITASEEPANNSPNARFFRETARESKYFNVQVPPNAELTQPYFLKKPRAGDIHRLENSANQNSSFEHPPISGTVELEINGAVVGLNQPAEYRYADDIRGEIRRNLNVVPRVSLSLDQNLLIVAQSKQAQTKRVTLNVKNNFAQKTGETGTAELKLPDGWRTKQNFASFQPSKKGENFSLVFDVIVPADAKTGEYEIAAVARIGGETYAQTTNEIAYPHIQTHRFYTAAKTKISVLDLKTAPAKIGYVTGSGDAIPEAIGQMGLSADLLNETDLTNGDLSKFDTIIVGIRAFQVRPDLISNNQRLLDYAKNGGVLIVQYQRPEYESLLPFPAKLGARVADENAKITILDRAHPVFNFPNKITDKDFQNWVQERNLYAFTTFDANYKPLLEAHDANEAENKGGLVVADIGKGKYIYCSYAFFRQLPAGVPGAYRLFANLLSVGKK